MKKEKFLEDLQVVYNEISRRDKELKSFYDLTKGADHPEAKAVAKEIIDIAGLKESSESIFGAISRLVDLREDWLKQAMENQRFSENRVIEALSRVYIYVDRFYTQRFEELVSWIEEKQLLTPFYRALIYGVHSIGISISQWQNSWSSHIIYGINRELFRVFNGDEEKIFEMLREKNLLDKHKNAVADRSYSVLISTNRGYKKLSYAEAFSKEVKEVSLALHILMDTLGELEDDVFGQKQEWIDYFETLYRAFNNRNSGQLIKYWADVDRAWMKITTPIQVGHPLEYYEDHYRKSVALEWDLRMINPMLQSNLTIKDGIKSFSAKISDELNDVKRGQTILMNNFEQIENTQVYIGRPALYYGAELNGLFSAQVVPNDEEVSNELGKKIFAYTDFVRESKLLKPIAKINIEALGEEFVKKEKRLAKYYPSLWNEVYEVTTIGHEFGHILWIDQDTETRMNERGQFKNIEEFKATSSALMAFFDNENSLLKEYLIDNLISRSVGLIGWKGVDSVLPYYCEGLMHLEILWLSGVVEFEGIKVKINYNAYDRLKALYRKCYIELAEHYIHKKPASEYLYKFISKDGKDYLPKVEALREFVLKYYEVYQKRGSEVVDLDFD